MANLKDRRNPSFREMIQTFSEQGLESYIVFYLDRLKDGYFEHDEANLAIMMDEYRSKYVKKEWHGLDDGSIKKYKEYEERFRKISKGIRYIN